MPSEGNVEESRNADLFSLTTKERKDYGKQGHAEGKQKRNASNSPYSARLRGRKH